MSIARYCCAKFTVGAPSVPFPLILLFKNDARILVVPVRVMPVVLLKISRFDIRTVDVPPALMPVTLFVILTLSAFTCTAPAVEIPVAVLLAMIGAVLPVPIVNVMAGGIAWAAAAVNVVQLPSV